jgi:hypothetical protein
VRVEWMCKGLLVAVAVAGCGSDDDAPSPGDGDNIVAPGTGPASEEPGWTPYPGFRRGLPDDPDSVMDATMVAGQNVEPFLGHGVGRHHEVQATRPIYPSGIWLGTSAAGVTRIARQKEGDDGPDLFIPNELRDGMALALVDDVFNLVFRRDTRAWTPHGIRRLWWLGADADVVVEGRGPTSPFDAANRQSVNPLEMPTTRATPAPASTLEPLLGGQPLLERGWYRSDLIPSAGFMPDASELTGWFRPVHVEGWQQAGLFQFRINGTCYEKSDAGPYFPKNCTECFRYDGVADTVSREDVCDQPNSVDPRRGEAPMPTLAEGFEVETGGGPRVLKLEGERVVTGPVGGPFLPVFPPLPNGTPAVLEIIAAPTDADPAAIGVVISDRAATRWVRVGSDGRSSDAHIGVGGAARRSHLLRADGGIQQWRVQPEGQIERVIADADGLWVERSVRIEPPVGQVAVGVAGEVRDPDGRVSEVLVLTWGRLRMWDYPDADRMSLQPDLGDVYLHRVVLPADAPRERQNPLFSLEARDLGPDARVCWPHGFDAPATTGWTLGDPTVAATVLPFDRGRCVLVVRGVEGVADIATHEVTGPIPGAGRVAIGVGSRHQAEPLGAGLADALDTAVVDWMQLGTLRDGGFRGPDALFETGFAARVATERVSAAWDAGQGAIVVPDRAGHGVWASWWDAGLRVVELRGREVERFPGETGVLRPDVFVAGGGAVVEDGAGLALRRADGTRTALSVWAEAGPLYRPKVVLPDGRHCGLVRRDVVDSEAVCAFPGLVGEDLWNCIGADIACVNADGVATTAPGAALTRAALWPESGALQFDGVALPTWYAFLAKSLVDGSETWTLVVEDVWMIEPETMQATPLLTEERLRAQGLVWARGASIFLSTALDPTGQLFAHARIEGLGGIDHHLFDFDSGAAQRLEGPSMRALGLGAVNLVAVEPALWILSRGVQVSDVVRIPR